MKVRAVAKHGGIWIPWHGDLMDGTALELNVDVVTNERNDSEDLNVLYKASNKVMPDESVTEFMSLTSALFGDGYHYTTEKSDREILEEVLSVKYS